MKEVLVLLEVFFYIDQSYLIHDCKMGSFQFTGGIISTWKSTGIFNYLNNSNMNAVGDFGGDLPDIKNDCGLYVYLSGNHFQQNKVIIPNNDNVINIYCVYHLLDQILLLYKMFYLELCKLLKMLILVNTSTKDMVFVLMKVDCLV